MESVVRLRRRPVASGLEILDLLTILQHLHPHRSLGAVLLELCNTMGTCRAATDRAVEWLNLDGTLAVGRIRRTELQQLSRAIHRFWIAALNAERLKSRRSRGTPAGV